MKTSKEKSEFNWDGKQMRTSAECFAEAGASSGTGLAPEEIWDIGAALWTIAGYLALQHEREEADHGCEDVRLAAAAYQDGLKDGRELEQADDA